MPPTELSSALVKYGNLCRNYRRKRVNCPYCDNFQIMFGDWSHHLKTVHSVDVRLTCPCCTGAIKWKRGDATKRLYIARHRTNCLEKFFKKHVKRAPTSKDEPDEILKETAVAHRENRPGPTEERRPAFPEASNLDATTPPADVASPACNVKPLLDGSACSCIDFFIHGRQPDMRGRTRQPEWGSFYDSYGNSTLFDVDQGTKHVKFLETSGLGISIYNVFYYYFTNQYTFYHVVVRALLWPAFKSHRFLPPGQLHVLPFWCLCDGAPTENILNRKHHRHMIFMMDKQNVGTFKKNWKSVVNPDVQRRNKMLINIKDVNHLMNAVYYISNPKATCDGIGRETSDTYGSHYWIAREVYPHAKLAMSLLWTDGQIKHVANVCQHKSIDSFFDHLQKKPLRVQLKYLNLTVRNCPIPFAKEQTLPAQCMVNPSEDMNWSFPLDEEPPTIFKYGVPVEMVQVPASQQLTLDESSVKEWFELQKLRNNLYWNAVEDYYYECSQSQQKAVYSAMRLKVKWSEKRKKELDRERCETHGWKTKYQDLCGEIQAMQDIKEHFREREKHFETLEKQLQESKRQCD